MSEYLRVLSSKTKNALLSSASKGVLCRRETACRMLSELERLNPDLRKSFDLKENALDYLVLRMLCYPKDHKPAGEITSFLVISYCWHSKPGDKEHWPPDNLYPKREGWDVYEPMVQKILTLRASEYEGVWLDKLCIRQDPKYNDEKNVAIGSMDVIYKSARRLIILLEDVRLEEDEVFAGQQYAEMQEAMSAYVREKGWTQDEDKEKKSAFIAGYGKRHIPKIKARIAAKQRELRGITDDGPATQRFLMKLLGARWFSRAWCGHEIKVVPYKPTDNPLFLCFGPGNANVVTFELRTVIYMAGRHEDNIMDQLLLSGPDSNTGVMLQRIHRLINLAPQIAEDVNDSLVQRFLNIINLGCRYRQDLVSITMNIAGIPLFYRGSYTRDVKLSEEEYKDRLDKELIWIFTLLTIASGDVSPLSQYGSGMRFPPSGNAVEGYSSWAVWPNDSKCGPRSLVRTIASIACAEKDFIEIDLLMFKGQPLPISSQAKEAATYLINKFSLQALSEEFSAEHQTEDARLMNQKLSTDPRVAKHASAFLERMLGMAIECGIDWIRRFPSRMNRDTEGVWCNNKTLRRASLELMAGFIISADSSREFQNIEDDYIKPTMRFLACLLDDKLQFLTIDPRPIQCGENDFAVTEVVTERSWVAVPVALANQPHDIRRAWIVEPLNPDETADDSLEDHFHLDPEADGGPRVFKSVSLSDNGDKRRPDGKSGRWRLRKRQVIYGCQELAATTTGEGGSIKLLQKQRVYGAQNYDWEAIERERQIQAALRTSDT